MPSGAATVVPLVVQLLSPLPAEEESALIESCSLAHQHGPCVREKDALAQNTLRATVEFPSETQVVIEITDTDASRRLFASRELRFKTEDDPGERSRAIGLALGVLSTSLTKNRAETPSLNDDKSDAVGQDSDEDQEAEPEAEPHEPRPPRAPLFWVSAALGGDMSPGWPGLGPLGELSAAVLPGHNLGAGVAGSMSWIPETSTRPSLMAVAATGDGLLRFSWPQSALWIQAGIGATWIQAHLKADDAPQPTGARLSPHGRLRVTWGRALGEHFFFTLSPQVQILLSPTEVFVDGERSATTGPFKAQATLGVAWTQ